MLNSVPGEVLSTRMCQNDRSGIRAKVRSLPDVVLFLQIVVFAAIVPYLLRLKISRVAAVLEWGGHRRTLPPKQGQVDKIAGYVELAIRRGRPIVRPGCLTRGLTRYYFFRRSGLDIALCFGMGRIEQEFMGHCWLVKDGEPFLELEDPRPRYVEVYRISRAGEQLNGNGNRRFSKA